MRIAVIATARVAREAIQEMRTMSHGAAIARQAEQWRFPKKDRLALIAGLSGLLRVARKDEPMGYSSASVDEIPVLLRMIHFSPRPRMQLRVSLFRVLSDVQ